VVKIPHFEFRISDFGFSSPVVKAGQTELHPSAKIVLLKTIGAEQLKVNIAACSVFLGEPGEYFYTNPAAAVSMN